MNLLIFQASYHYHFHIYYFILFFHYNELQQLKFSFYLRCLFHPFSIHLTSLNKFGHIELVSQSCVFLRCCNDFLDFFDICSKLTFILLLHSYDLCLDFYSKHVVKNTFNYPCLLVIEDPLLVLLFVIIHRRFFGVIITIINDLNA